MLQSAYVWNSSIITTYWKYCTWRGGNYCPITVKIRLVDPSFSWTGTIRRNPQAIEYIPRVTNIAWQYNYFCGYHCSRNSKCWNHSSRTSKFWKYSRPGSKCCCWSFDKFIWDKHKKIFQIQKVQKILNEYVSICCSSGYRNVRLLDTLKKKKCPKGLSEYLL